MTIPCITVGSGDHHVFVLHGWFGSADGWGLFPTYLDGQRFSYHFTDNRGYGARMDQRGHYSLDEVADDVLALADSLDVQTFSLIGPSMGGAEVLRDQAGPRQSSRAVPQACRSYTCRRHADAVR